jgi:hypothetical protein
MKGYHYHESNEFLCNEALMITCPTSSKIFFGVHLGKINTKMDHVRRGIIEVKEREKNQIPQGDRQSPDVPPIAAVSLQHRSFL